MNTYLKTFIVGIALGVMLQLVAILFNIQPLYSLFFIIFTTIIILLNMKKIKNWLPVFLGITMLTTSCTWVKPNYAGVLMQNYGRNGKSDFSLVSGKVSTWGLGTELFSVPLYEQRGEYKEPMHLKAADNTEFTAQPTYSYTVIKEKAIDVVFNNRQLGSGDDFLESVEDNILEMRIRDVIKEESRRYTTDTLMGKSGSLMFEEHVQTIIKEMFNKVGFELLTFSAQLDFPDKVKEKITQRNEVQQNISVVDQQIEEQKKKIILAKLKAEENIELSKGLTPQLLQQQAQYYWYLKGCPTPSTITGSNSSIYIPTSPK